MTSLIHQVDSLIQSNLETILSESDQEDGLLALDAYSQQMEDYLDVLEEMTKTMGEGVRRLRNKQRQFESMTMEADRSARQFARERQGKLARAAYARKEVMHQASEAFQEEADIQNERFQALMDVRLRLEARLTEVAQKRALLQAQQTLSTANV
jgi:phage shock protein A